MEAVRVSLKISHPRDDGGGPDIDKVTEHFALPQTKEVDWEAVRVSLKISRVSKSKSNHCMLRGMEIDRLEVVRASLKISYDLLNPSKTIWRRLQTL